MIQRIQTLYLLLISALIAVMFLLPLAWFAGEGGVFELRAFALRSTDGQTVHTTIYLIVLLAAALLLPLVTIFLYRRRLLQIRLCCVEIVLLLGCLLMEGVYYYLAHRAFADWTFHAQGIKPAIALPVVGLFFACLAAKAIFKDELLIRESDRIR